MTVWALQILALTGLRRDEILDLKWSMVDWQHALFNLPDTKTDQQCPRRLWRCCGRSALRPASPTYASTTSASDAIMGGVPLAVVGKLLGHRQARTTERYAHIADKVVQDAVEHTAARIADAVKPALVAPPAPPPFRVLSNVQWAKVAPIVCAGRSARAQAHLRKAVDGIRWVLHHNASWREIPREYGSYTSCWRWHSRWEADGTWAHVATALG